jgi:hypothetical protein
MDAGKLAAWLAFTGMVLVVSPPRGEGTAAGPAPAPATAPAVQPVPAREMRADCWPRHRRELGGERRTVVAGLWRESQWNWTRGKRRSGC